LGQLFSGLAKKLPLENVDLNYTENICDVIGQTVADGAVGVNVGGL
jgi:hypothetical protein